MRYAPSTPGLASVLLDTTSRRRVENSGSKASSSFAALYARAGDILATQRSVPRREPLQARWRRPGGTAGDALRLSSRRSGKADARSSSRLAPRRMLGLGRPQMARCKNCPQACVPRCGRPSVGERVTPYCFPRWRSTASTPPPRTAPSPASKRPRDGNRGGQCGRTLSGGVGSDGALVAVGTFDGEVIALDARSASAMARARIERGAIGAIVTGSGDRPQRRRPPVRARREGRQAPLAVSSGRARLSRSVPPWHDRRPGYLLTGFAGGKLVSIALATAPCAGRRPSPSLAEPRNWNASPMSSGCRSSPSAKYAPCLPGRIGCFDPRAATRSGRASCRAPPDSARRALRLCQRRKGRGARAGTVPAARRSGSRIACS